ncbi:MAG TPA: ribonuclease Y [Gemmatimonadales bacterium]|nr:ribonuclease Y [Gemmatimonadales bacterium]
MPETLLLPLVAGVAAGLAVAFAVILGYVRRQQRSASGIVASAHAEAERLRAEARQETERLRTEAEREAARETERLRAEAQRDAEAARAAAVLEGRMETLRVREELEREVQRRREEFERLERRVDERGRALDRKQEEVENQERAFARREQGLAQREGALVAREGEIDRLVQEQRAKLERVAGLSAEEARQQILQRVEDEARSQAGQLVRDIKEQARRGAEREARRIIAMAIQRLGAETTAETTVAAVALPSDEMKGRIIGREGRNIRAFETATGVDLIIDDTPDTVIVSCFDPVRREVARRALEALIVDGRIHPGRIEEIVARVQKELDAQLVELGEQAVYETGVHGMHPELIKLVGRMRYRTSYGQNILEHSKEVAHLAGAMAAELHLDVALAKRGALLHDVGKVLTHDSDLTHVELGVEVARRYGESAAVINCIQAHHDDVPHESAESVLVQAADAISGSRPGARREAYDTYVKRLAKLEEIANAFPGVEKSSVIQAGREIRVVVTPEQVDDGQAAALSESIARKVENELQYPGQIKVVVIRETRAVDYAK